MASFVTKSNMDGSRFLCDFSLISELFLARFVTFLSISYFAVNVYLHHTQQISDRYCLGKSYAV